MEGDQVNQDGDQGNQNQDQNQSLGWRSALPDEYKEHEFVKTFTKPGDFVKSALEIKTEHDALKTRLEGAIFKPDDKATPEQREAFYRSLGKPDKATEYEFPKADGAEHDPEMVKWAQEAFHAANLNKEQAQAIGKAWDGFIDGMVTADKEAKEKAITDTEAKLKTEWMGDYDKNVELSKRAFKKFADQELIAFLEETGMGNAPLLTKVFANIGKAMGDDTSPQGALPKGETPQIGMNYKMDTFKGG